MSRRLATTTLVLGGVLAGSGAQARAATGDVTFTLRERPSDQVFIEGAVQDLRVISVRTGQVVHAHRFSGGRRHRVTLPVGRYRVRSWTRPCDGTCQTLDPPTGACRGRFRAQRRNQVTVRISTKVGARCRIRVASTGVGAP